MKKNLLIILIILFLQGCASKMEKPIDPIKKNRINPALHSAWINQIPGNNYVIGIAKISNDVDSMKESAKQMAAVMMNRNKSSFVIKNYAAIDKEDMLKSDDAKFELNVGSTKELRKIYQDLELVDYSIAYGYFFGLFSLNGIDVPNKTKIKNPFVQPSWFEEDKFSDEGNLIVCHTKATSSNLVTAWQNAAEKARQKYAEYFTKDVQGRILSYNEDVRVDVAVETSIMLKNLQINKSYFVPHCKNEIWRFDVYFETIMEK